MDEPVTGLKELQKRLQQIERRTANSILRRSVSAAVQPVARQMRAKAPVGTAGHRSKKGRLYAPGNLKRSVRIRTKIMTRKGGALANIGVLPDAWYGVQLLDRGPWRISKRRVSSGLGRRKVINIKPYTLPKRPFFQSVFLANINPMAASLAAKLRAELDKI